MKSNVVFRQGVCHNIGYTHVLEGIVANVV